MITCAASSAGQKDNISKSLLCLVSLFISSQALTLEIETPAILLATVPVEIRVSGALPGEQVRLSVAGTFRVASADADGIAVFPEIAAERRGSIALSALATASGSASSSLRVLPGWASIMPPLVKPDKSGRLLQFPNH